MKDYHSLTFGNSTSDMILFTVIGIHHVNKHAKPVGKRVNILSQASSVGPHFVCFSGGLSILQTLTDKLRTVMGYPQEFTKADCSVMHL